MSIDRYDLMSFAGLAAVGVGLWLWSPALALVVCGTLLLLAGLFGSYATGLRRSREKGKRQGGDN